MVGRGLPHVRIRRRQVAYLIEQPLHIDGHVLQVGVSIGVVLYPDHGDSAETLIDRADQAMYEAKKSGDIIRIFAA
ncbi:MAG: diguanylate cyclase [Magnetospirillum sp.]